MTFKSYENDGGLMAEGDYECILVKCCETTTKTSGMPVIAFDFQVRSDIEQKYQRKHIFRNFYQDRETYQWPMEKIGKLANSLGVPKGEEFELEDLVGKCCILHMKPMVGNDGVERDTVFWTAPTKAGQIMQSAVPAVEAGYTDVTDDEDLPF